jgi:type IV pilus assembly protein PilA
MFKKFGLKLKEQKGFTLIELLAVIVILGIIAAIAIPAIGNVINKSESKAKVQEGLQIINAAKLHITDKELTTDITKLTPANLNNNLDHVKDKTFNVYVTKEKDPADATKYTGKLIYSIDTHDSVPVVKAGATEGTAANGSTAAVPASQVTEQELIDYKAD